MKIAFLIQGGQGLYGAERATLMLVRGLLAAGTEVRVFRLQEMRIADSSRPDDMKRALAAFVEVRDIPVAGRFSLSAIRQLRGELTAWSADLLHTTGYKADLHGGMAAKWGRLLPVVSTVHGWLFRKDPKERFFQWLNIRVLRHFSRVIVLSRFYENYMRRQGLAPLQLARIPQGFRVDDIVPAATAGRLWEQSARAPFVFGMLGRLSSEKHHTLFLRAAARLARRMKGSPMLWRLQIAGDGPLRETILRTAKRLGIADRLEMPGRIPPQDFFLHTHVLVQCSKVENQPMSVMEAMAWKRPVIATPAGGLPEWVEDGVTGRLLPSHSSRLLAAAMLDFLLSPESACACGERARRELERRFSFEAMVEDHIGLYNALLAPRQPAG